MRQAPVASTLDSTPRTRPSAQAHRQAVEKQKAEQGRLGPATKASRPVYTHHVVGTELAPGPWQLRLG